MTIKKKLKVLLWLSFIFMLISMIFCILKQTNSAVAIGLFSSAVSTLGLYFIFYK